MKYLAILPIAGTLALLLLPVPAEACQGGRTVVSGETVAQVAALCGINPESLRQLNPGLSDRTIRPGLIVTVPPRPLPSPQAGYGRSQVTVQPPAAVSPRLTVRMPRTTATTPPPHRIERPLIGHMPSILEPF